MSVESLEASVDKLRHWLTFWTLVVAVGLILEYRKQLWAIALLSVKIIRLKSTPFDRCIWRRLCIISIGGILVTIGVMGELWIEFRASRVENDLRLANAKVIADLNKDAEAARKESASIRRETIGFSIQLEAAKKDVAQANERT